MSTFRKTGLSTIAVLLLANLSHGQDLGSLGTNSPAKAPATDSPAAPAETIRPSRFFIQNPDSLIAALQPRLRMIKQPIDVFGLPQDPEAPRPVIKGPTAAPVQAAVRTPLSAAVQKLNVNMVMPSKGSFMIGANTIRVGQAVTFKSSDTTYKAQVERIEAHAITFRDLETKEIAQLRLDLLPSEIQKGQNAQEIAPGMQRASEVPIEIDTNSSN